MAIGSPVDEIRRYHDELTAIRRDIHANPELGLEEHRTAELVAQKLEEWGIEVHRGVGGTGVVGVLMMPCLIYLAGFSQHRATGTSLAVLLPPIGLAAAWEYYRHGDVDVRAALVLAVFVFCGGWIGAVLASRISGPYLRLAFGVFTVVLGVSLVVGALRRLAWI